MLSSPEIRMQISYRMLMFHTKSIMKCGCRGELTSKQKKNIAIYNFHAHSDHTLKLITVL